ncbi:hypothetical protein A9G13_01940 [Gilliamella sp. wkB178]|uniref:EexN family lipoprotein n=1 Tax=Gilliamella sp. wkB178 TaxID=3120259 RepID=UPI00080DB033|nr:EexN family lipoprotein [Gilliamella apicola]OCG08845.1 hypothetical protein A9G13_01940 [Gilliamella apicola]
MKKIILLSAVIASFLLTACNDKIYTVKEFKEDKGLRDKYFQKCNNGELKPLSDENCINVMNAKIATDGFTQWSSR